LFAKIESPINGSVTDSWEEFIKNGIWVDKSLFIKEIINADSHLFISIPPKWGKSLNFSMLQTFLQPNGDDQEYYENGIYNFTKTNKNAKLFKDYKIAKESTANEFDYDRFEKGSDKANFIKQFQGQNPVVYLNFNEVSGTTFDKIQ